jgi:hypothetical protein
MNTEVCNGYLKHLLFNFMWMCVLVSEGGIFLPYLIHVKRSQFPSFKLYLCAIEFDLIIVEALTMI